MMLMISGTVSSVYLHARMLVTEESINFDRAPRRTPWSPPSPSSHLIRARWSIRAQPRPRGQMRLGAVARERRVLLRGGRPGRCLDAALSSLLDPRKIFTARFQKWKCNGVIIIKWAGHIIVRLLLTKTRTPNTARRCYSNYWYSILLLQNENYSWQCLIGTLYLYKLLARSRNTHSFLPQNKRKDRLTSDHIAGLILLLHWQETSRRL